MAGMTKNAPADLNLLFGILALQMDFIDRDELVQAMNAWVLNHVLFMVQHPAPAERFPLTWRQGDTIATNATAKETS